MSFRADFYRFLSSLFLQEVSLDLLKNLSSLKKISLPVETGDAEGLIPPRGRNLDEIKEELDVDFARIFLGLGRQPAFPYESIYRSRSGLLMQEPFDEVRDIYRMAGVKKIPDLKEPEDHIAVELAFMANLCSRAGMAFKDNRSEDALIQLEIQKEFLQNHLSSWIPSLCADIERVAQTGFYKSLAALLRSWIISEGQELANRIGDHSCPK